MLNNKGKKALFAVIALILFAARPGAKAWAADLTINSYDAFYTVANYGSTEEASEFTINSKPWLYLKLDATTSIDNTISWISPSTNTVSQSATTIGNAGLWVSMSDVDWNTYKEIGLWAVSGSAFKYSSRNFKFYASASDFTVAPEPLSCVLFLTGGGLLAVLKRQRKVVQA